MANVDASSMQEFYRDKVVFLTGATGVLGELFIQKLLRCNVRRVYILLREKHGVSNRERIVSIYTTALFEPLRIIDPAYMKRISIIAGDMSAPMLGIGPADRLLLAAHVQIVVHAAANVRFDCPLPQIVLTNVRGTRDLLRLAAEFGGLLSFVYVSTAFCHSHTRNRRTEERFYPAPIDPDNLIRIAEGFTLNERITDADTLTALTAKVISPWPNTYSFSKAASEEVVRRAMSRLPIVVVRPSIVIATYKDPIPGYCTNYFGLNGALAASGMGICRTAAGDLHSKANLVCADYAINSTLAIVWDRVVNKQLKVPAVYTLNSVSDDLTWDKVTETLQTEYGKNPWLKTVWLPSRNWTMCPVIEFYNIIMYQLIAGQLTDCMLSIVGRKERILPIVRRFVGFMSVLKFFMSMQWDFQSENLNAVSSRMSVNDRRHFPIEIIDIRAYGNDYSLGLRRYLAKESIETLPAAKQKYFRLLIQHYAVLTVYYALIAGFYYKLFQWFVLP